MSDRAVSGAALLRELPEAERRLIEAAMEEVTVDAGHTVARAGDFGWAMYVIVDGSVDVLDTDGALVATLGPGDVFGEVALLRAGRRMADAVARAPLTLNVLFTRDFQRLRADVPVFEAALRTLIDARLDAVS